MNMEAAAVGESGKRDGPFKVAEGGGAIVEISSHRRSRIALPVNRLLSIALRRGRKALDQSAQTWASLSKALNHLLNGRSNSHGK